MRNNTLILATFAACVAALSLGAFSPALAGPRGAKADRPAKEPVVIDGAAVYRASCNRCHNARAVEELGPEHWEMVVTHMQVRASLPARDAAALMLWLNPPVADDPVAWAAAATRAFPDLPLLAERCARCHGPERVEAAIDAGQNSAWWSATLARMRAYGANLKPKEESSLSGALTTRASGSKE